jgi:hypothetical protein
VRRQPFTPSSWTKALTRSEAGRRTYPGIRSLFRCANGQLLDPNDVPAAGR